MATDDNVGGLLGQWLAKPASDVTEGGSALSRDGTAPLPSSSSSSASSSTSSCSSSQSGWLDAKVPETTLALLVRCGLAPDPSCDFNLRDIPDVYHAGRDFYTFWWCSRVATPSKGNGGKRRTCSFPFWRPDETDTTTFGTLLINGVNYAYEVWWNGKHLVSSEGAFFRRTLPISLAPPGQMNFVAIKVAPPFHPGCVDKGGQGGDHMIAKDVTSQFVEGWDWIQPIPDRNTGIWGEVRVQWSGCVILQDPCVRVSFANASENDFTAAEVHLAVSCTNLSSSKLSSVVIKAAVTSESGEIVGQTWTKTVGLESNSCLTDIDLGCNMFSNPLLWYPSGYGKQNLYKVEITAEVSDRLSHEITTTFGYRHLESYYNSATNSREFSVNGIRIFIRGGNYIVPDAMLRCGEDRCFSEVKYHARMGLNMIRLWGGAGVPLDSFYEACDLYGVMVWSEFWITGDCDGRGSTKDSPESNPNWPLDHLLFLQCASDVIKQLRNHPSLVLWCGGNEQVPCREIDQGLRIMLGCGRENCTNYFGVAPDLDNTRPYVSGSLWGGFGQGEGDWSDGPYGIQNDQDFFSPTFYKYGFNPELGSVGVPCVETMRSIFTTPENQEPPKYLRNPDGTVKEVVSSAWDFHKYITYCTSDGHSKILAYGEPSCLSEFCTQAQIVNFTQYRALVEGWGSFMWSKYTGMLIWKTANPWTSLRGQLYDWYLNPCGGYFGVKGALTEDVHIQLNSFDNVLEVVNTSCKTVKVMVNVEVISDKREREQHGPFTTPGQQTTKLGVKLGLPVDTPSFVKLSLVPVDGGLELSRNIYWFGLSTWRAPEVKLDVKVSHTGDPHTLDLEIHNPTDSVGFWIEILALKTADREEAELTVQDLVLPVYFSDNYITLFPQERRTVQIESDLEEGVAALLVRGWNSKSVRIKMFKNKFLM